MPIARLFYQGIVWKGLFFLSAFILNVLIARYYGASASGHIFYLINLYAFIILIVSLSLESAMGYYTSRNEISLHKLINFCFLWIALVAAAFVIFILNQDTNSQITVVAIMFICGNLLSNYCTAISYAKSNFFIPNVINICINLLLIVLLSLMHFPQTKIINDEDFVNIFFSAMLVQGFATAILVGFKYAGTWKFYFPNSAQLKKIFRFGLIAFSANVISFLLYRIDYWFVKEFCNATDLGNYIQVSKLAQVFFILPGILAGTVFPLTAGGKRQQINELLSTFSRLIFIFYFFCCGILALTGYWLFPFLFGESFKNMYVPFLLLIPGILALSTLYTLTAYNSGKNKISINIKGASIALAFIIVCDLIFIPRFGISAAALISSLGYVIYHIYVLSVFTKEYGSTAISFFNFKFSDIQKIKNSISQVNK